MDVDLLALARLHEERGASVEAAAVWRRSFDRSPTLEAGYQLLRRNPAPAEKRWIEGLLPGNSLDAVRGLLRRGPTLPRHSARHIAIRGISYCGSTLLGRLLDSFDGFHDIGESHWLIEQRQWVNGSRAMDFFRARPSRSTVFCTQCGAGCKPLSMPFRLELQLNRSHWYFRLAERLDARVVVSSDKNSWQYAKLDPLLRFDAIVLFKHPLAAWHSFRKREPGPSRQLGLDEFAEVWISEYEDALRMKPQGRKVFMWFDDLAAGPASAVKRLLASLGLPPAAPDLAAPMKGRHSIGGNDAFIATTRRARRIEIRSNAALEIPAAERRFLTANRRMSEVFEELLSRRS